jgi:hypothetical protein
MNFQRLFRMSALLLLGAAAGTTMAWAQDPQQQPQQQPQDQDPGSSTPKPAARGIPALDPNATVEDQQQTTNWQPDTGPVTGLQDPTLGSPELDHSYWVPGVIVGTTIQSRPPGELANTGWYTDTYVGGQASVLEVGGRSEFGLNFSGGGFFTSDSQEQNGWFSELSAGYSVRLNRLSVQVFDYFSYLPESQFGFAAGTGLALPGITGTLGPTIPGLGASIVPSQSIYSAVGPRYSNAFAVQSTYMLSHRSSLTVGGAYGLLNFTQAGNVNNDMVIGNIGYNYVLNPHDTIGVLYRFTGFHYDGEPQALGTQIVNFVYQKKIAQKLALSLFGGPEFTTFRVPVANQNGTTNVSAGAQFHYAFPRTTFLLSYFHGVTAGSGVLLGSTSDEATATLERRLGRVWSGRVNFGYSRNEALTTLPGTTNSNYNDWFVGGSVSRPFGRTMVFTGSYEASFESTNQGVCQVQGTTACNSSYTVNLIAITFQYHMRPFMLP